jgi:hypothetical protein
LILVVAGGATWLALAHRAQVAPFGFVAQLDHLFAAYEAVRVTGDVRLAASFWALPAQLIGPSGARVCDDAATLHDALDDDLVQARDVTALRPRLRDVRRLQAGYAMARVEPDWRDATDNKVDGGDVTYVLRQTEQGWRIVSAFG